MNKPEWRGWPGFLGRAIGAYLNADEDRVEMLQRMSDAYDQWIEAGRPDHDPGPVVVNVCGETLPLPAVGERVWCKAAGVEATVAAHVRPRTMVTVQYDGGAYQVYDPVGLAAAPSGVSEAGAKAGEGDR